MFIRQSNFKKLLKNAYDGAGLTVGRDEDGILLSGGYWIIWLKESAMSKKAIASIIELTRDLPAKGEIFVSIEGGNQYEIPEIDRWGLLRKADEADVPYKVTGVAVKYGRGYSRILQHPGTNDTKMISNSITEMISIREMDTEVEEQPIGPVVREDNQTVVYWKNNVCILAACLIDPQEYGEELLRLLQSLELE